MLARTSRGDRLLLGVYLPLYLLAVGLHAHESARSGLAQLPIFARRVAGDYPVVAGYPLETDSSGSGLEPGDRLLRIGERDLRGQGYVGVRAIGLARTQPGRPVALLFERDGVQRTGTLEARPHALPWARLPVLLLVPLVCTLLMRRAPGSAPAQRFFFGFVTYALTQAEFYGGPEWKTWLAAGVQTVAGPLSVFGMFHFARRFPDEMPESARIWAGWPVLAAVAYLVFVRGSYVLGWPVASAWVPRVSFSSHALGIAMGIGILGWNYAHAFAAGRRRLRWILLGALLGSVPLVMTSAAPLLVPHWRGFAQAYALGFLGVVLWISGLVFAVLRDSAFDVDRLLGATATGSVVAAATVVGLAVGVPAAGSAVANGLDLDPRAVRLALAALLGALMVPLALRLRMRIDALLFPGRDALREAAERLTEELAPFRSPEELLAMASRRITSLLDAEGHALYQADAEGWRRACAGGLSPPERLPASIALPTRLAPGNAPAELSAHGVVLGVPMLLEGRLDAFLCLGRKRSGDIYTRTDTDALAALTARIEAQRERLAKEQSDRESRAKSNLIAAASHDLRQPLHAVGLLAETLRGRLTDPAARDIVSRIGASTEELDEMLTSLLDRSRLDAGTVPVRRERFELAPLLAQLERDFAGTAAARGLRLRVAPTHLAVESDRLLLLRILRNLVSNAIRYTPAGRVWVGARRRGDEIRIEVRDSGPGIAVEAQRKIFEAFHQLPAASRAGLGLGLSIVDGLARMLGHTVELRSAPGCGSTFAVHVPRAVAAHCPPAAPEPVVRPTRCRVLVVDDDAAVLAATAELLRSWGCEVREARGFEDALEAAALWRPERALLDYDLGSERTGSELAAQLRAAYGETMQIALITAEPDAARREALRAEGFVVLRKPLAPARLRALLAPF